MSDHPTALIERFYAAIERRDVDALRAMLSDDVRWSAPAVVPGGGMRRGPDAVLEGAQMLIARWPEVRAIVERVRVRGTTVAVRGRYLAPGGAGVPFTDIVTVRDGKVASVLSSYDAGALRRAMAATGPERPG